MSLRVLVWMPLLPFLLAFASGEERAVDAEGTSALGGYSTTFVLTAPCQIRGTPEDTAFLVLDAVQVLRSPQASCSTTSDGAWITVRVWRDELPTAKALIADMATEPFKEWDMTLCISASKLGPDELAAAEKEVLAHMRAMLKERPNRLKKAVRFDSKATIRDALEALADLLVAQVIVRPELMHSHENDWEELLAQPLKPTEEQLADGLTVQDLIIHVSKRLKAAAQFEGICLVFDTRQAAAQRRETLERLKKTVGDQIGDAASSLEVTVIEDNEDKAGPGEDKTEPDQDEGAEDPADAGQD